MATSDTTRPPLSRWSLVTAITVGAAVVLALVLAATVATRLGEDRPRASAGDIFTPPGHGKLPPDAATVDLPWGSVSVAVGDVTKDVPEELGDPSLITPPDGGSFVRVDLRPEQEKGGVPFISTGKPWTTRAEVVLTAGGTEYPLDGPDGIGVAPDSPMPTGGPTRWVALDSRPSDLSVTITVGGQEQTVAMDGSVTRGRAAALEDVPTTEKVREGGPTACGTPKQSGIATVRVAPSDEPECRVAGSLRTPFVDGLGWAPKGHEYLVVQTTHDETFQVTSEDDRAWTIETELTALLNDVRPENDVTEVGGQVLGNAADTQFVFEVPTGAPAEDLTLLLDVEAEPTNPIDHGRPENPRLEWTILKEGLA